WNRQRDDRARRRLRLVEAGKADLLAEIDDVAIELGVIDEEIARRLAGLLRSRLHVLAGLLDGVAGAIKETVGTRCSYGCRDDQRSKCNGSAVHGLVTSAIWLVRQYNSTNGRSVTICSHGATSL